MKNFFLYFNKLIIPSIFLVIGLIFTFSSFNGGKPQTIWFMIGGLSLTVFSLIWILLQLNVLSIKNATIIAVALILPILFLAYRNYKSVENELKYLELVDVRFDAVKNHLIKIREAELAYKKTYNKYCDNFDTLIYFVQNGTIPELKITGNMDDSVAVANGLARIDTNWVAVIGNAYMLTFPVDSLRYVPFGKDNTQFSLAADMLGDEATAMVPVFEASTNWRDFLGDLWKDYGRIPKDSIIKVGSLDEPTTNGSWGK